MILFAHTAHTSSGPIERTLCAASPARARGPGRGGRTVIISHKWSGRHPSRRGCKGALEAFDLRHQKLQVCIEKFEEFDARTG